MFVILPDEVMNEWAEWLAKKSFDLTATGIFSVELPAKATRLDSGVHAEVNHQ